jgi:hypothetical protein
MEGFLMTDNLIDQVLEALEGATGGPWFLHDFSHPVLTDTPTAQDVTVSCVHPDHITVAVMAGGDAGHQDLQRARYDARLIALAPDMARHIIATEERLKAAVEALKPFAEEAKYREASDSAWKDISNVTCTISIGDLRRAEAVFAAFKATEAGE